MMTSFDADEVAWCHGWLFSLEMHRRAYLSQESYPRGTPIRALSALPFRLTILEEGVDTLVFVFGREQL
jgi:hypothetical protein